MPAVYEKIRDYYMRKGLSKDKAQEYGAATYNKIRKQHPGMAKLSNKPEGSKKK